MCCVSLLRRMNQQQQIEKMEILLSGGVVLLDHAMDKSEAGAHAVYWQRRRQLWAPGTNPSNLELRWLAGVLGVSFAKVQAWEADFYAVTQVPVGVA